MRSPSSGRRSKRPGHMATTPALDRSEAHTSPQRRARRRPAGQREQPLTTPPSRQRPATGHVQRYIGIVGAAIRDLYAALAGHGDAMMAVLDELGATHLENRDRRHDV